MNKRNVDDDDDDGDDVEIIETSESVEKKFAPLLADKNEISITPIRKSSADDNKQNAKEATVA